MRHATQQVRHTHHRKALTLVELLVATGALALLLGQVVPAAKKARDEARQMTCTQRLARIAAGGLTYAAEDPNELAIPIGSGDRISEPWPAPYSFGGKSGRGPTATANASMFSGSPVYRMGSPDRPLNPILYKREFLPPPIVTGGGVQWQDWTTDTRLDLEVYRCPNDTGFSGMHHKGWKDAGTSSYDYYGTSYAANVVLQGIPGPGTPLDSISPYQRPLSRVPDPAATALYLENAARFAIFATNPELDQTGCYWPYHIGDMTANGWHGTPWEFFVAHTDGHVARLTIRGHERADNPLGAILDCVYARGPGYQLDTFPDRLWATRKTRSGGAGGIARMDGRHDVWQIVAAD